MSRKFRSKFEELDPHGSVCGRVETLEHFILECLEVTRGYDEIQKMLERHEESTGRIIEETKRTLERWEKRSFQFLQASHSLNLRHNAADLILVFANFRAFAL